MSDAMGIGDNGSPRFPRFLEMIAETAHLERTVRNGSVRVLELGTLRWEPDRPTHHRHLLPENCEHVRSDVQAGTDVDVVVDAHELGAHLPWASFDAVLAVSVWEHLARPWMALQEVADILKPGGLVYIETHHTFPVHGYPSDFTRWTDQGLAALCEWAGLEVIDGGFSYPCVIKPNRAVTRWNTAAPAYMNVDVLARKPLQ